MSQVCVLCMELASGRAGVKCHGSLLGAGFNLPAPNVAAFKIGKKGETRGYSVNMTEIFMSSFVKQANPETGHGTARASLRVSGPVVMHYLVCGAERGNFCFVP